MVEREWAREWVKERGREREKERKERERERFIKISLESKMCDFWHSDLQIFGLKTTTFKSFPPFFQFHTNAVIFLNATFPKFPSCPQDLHPVWARAHGPGPEVGLTLHRLKAWPNPCVAFPNAQRASKHKNNKCWLLWYTNTFEKARAWPQLKTKSSKRLKAQKYWARFFSLILATD